MGFCRKVKWTVNMARTGSSFLVLFCCFSRVAPQAPSSGKQKERKGSLGEHDRSPSPVPVCDAQRNLHPSPEGKGSKLLLPFPRGEGVRWWHCHHLLLAVETPLELKHTWGGRAASSSVSHRTQASRSTRNTATGKTHADTKALGTFFLLAKYFKFSVTNNGKLTSESQSPPGSPASCGLLVVMDGHRWTRMVRPHSHCFAEPAC